MRRLRTEEEVGGRVGGEWYIVETKKQPKEEKEIKGWEEFKGSSQHGKLLTMFAKSSIIPRTFFSLCHWINMEKWAFFVIACS